MKNKCLLFISAGMVFISSCSTVQPYTLGDFIISTKSSGENSIAAMPPVGTSDHGGTIALNRGVAWHTTTGFCIYKNIFINGNMDYTQATEAGFTANSTPGEINEALDSLSSSEDNQMVRMDNGDLLLEKDCFYWKANNAINWLSTPMDYNHPGERSAACFWRSSDSGKTWSLFSVLDPVDFDGGIYALPTTPQDANGAYHHGGFDRPEMYFCPFKKRVYFTSNAGGGLPSVAHPFLFYSDNHGKTWHFVAQFEGNAPHAMTSTGDGKLFITNYANGRVNLFFTNEVNGKPVLQGPFKMGYVASGDTMPSADNVKPSTIVPNAGLLSVSRVTVDPTQVYDVVRIAYEVNSPGLTESFAVFDAFLNKLDGRMFTIPITIINAADPMNYHVTFGEFIDPDFLELPQASNINTSVFYWIEQSVPGSPVGNQYMAKYCIFTDGVDFTAPKYLSLTSSFQNRHWTDATKSQEGDYLKGGFFWYGNTLNYLCDWDESSGIHGNIISLTPAYQQLTYSQSTVSTSSYPVINWNDFKPRQLTGNTTGK
jgi:hypothetical protein